MKGIMPGTLPNALFDHNAALLSSLVHNNTTLFRAAANANYYMPHLKYSRVQAVADPDIGSNFKSDYLFNAKSAEDHDCSATNIHSHDAAFTTVGGKTLSLAAALVEWTDSAGANPGYVYAHWSAITATNLTIYKVSGEGFQNSGKFTIKKAWYEVPTTGVYLVIGAVRTTDTNIVADKRYYSIIAVNGVPVYTTFQHASVAQQIISQVVTLASLTASDQIALWSYNNSGVDTIIIWGDVPSIALSLMLLRAT